MFLSRLFGASPQSCLATSIYAQIVAQARHPQFYETHAVPDTLDGRFDMIVLHAFLVMHRLKGQGEAAEALSQEIFDEMFLEMDRALREMGVGDLSVPKRIKKMAKAFYGRAEAYEAALGEKGDDALKQALARNIFPDGAPDEAALDALGSYVRTNVAALSRQPLDTFLKGELAFSGPETIS